MREIKADEAYKVYDCLESMAEHHNKVSTYFKGHYPTMSSKEIIRDFERKLEEGKAFISVVENKDKVVGFCKISVNGSEGVIDYLAVLEEERGRGYGTALIDWAFKKFAELNITGIELKVVYGNDVINLYKKYGFKEKSIIMRVSK